MKQMIKMIIKVIPLLSLVTLYQGVVTKGGSLDSLIEVLRVGLTEYEITQVTQLLLKDTETTKELLQRPQDFEDFVQNNFYSQYSVFARELKGDKEYDQSRDIWGMPFTLITQEGMLKIISSGPDRILNTKDDIATEIQVIVPKKAPRKVIKRVAKVIAPKPEPATPRAPAAFVYYDSLDVYDSEGFNREGFDKEGYDRDGYDRNGIHFSEKEDK